VFRPDASELQDAGWVVKDIVTVLAKVARLVTPRLIATRHILSKPHTPSGLLEQSIMLRERQDAYRLPSLVGFAEMGEQTQVSRSWFRSSSQMQNPTDRATPTKS